MSDKPVRPYKLSNGTAFRHVLTSHQPGMLSALHCHNAFELIYLISGTAAHVVEGRKYILKPGDLALVRPSTYHYLQLLTDEPYERYNLLFDPVVHGVESALELPETMEVVSLRNNPIAANLFQKLDHYHANLGDGDFETILLLMLRELFVNLKISADAEQQKETILSPILTSALEYINANLFSISGVDEVAQALFISPSYLFHLFRTSLHRTPKKYISDKRLLAAQRRIREGQKPTAVYKECGFREYTSFYRSYCSFFGHPPSRDSGE